MDSVSKKLKRTASVAAILFLMALVTAIVLWGKNKALNNALDREKLRSEELLSEKLATVKESENLTSAYHQAKLKNKSLSDLIDKSNKTLAETQYEISRLHKEKKRYNEVVGKLAAARQELIDAKTRVEGLELKTDELLLENQEIKKSLASSQELNHTLKNQVELLKPARADNYRIESQKYKNERLTVSARRTTRLAVTFHVPEDQTNNLSFKVTTPQGITVTDPSKDISWLISDRTEVVEGLASTSQATVISSKKVQLIFKPKEKFSKGIYCIQMFNHGSYIGSCSIKLR